MPGEYISYNIYIIERFRSAWESMMFFIFCLRKKIKLRSNSAEHKFHLRPLMADMSLDTFSHDTANIYIYILFRNFFKKKSYPSLSRVWIDGASNAKCLDLSDTFTRQMFFQQWKVLTIRKIPWHKATHLKGWRFNGTVYPIINLQNSVNNRTD